MEYVNAFAGFDSFTFFDSGREGEGITLISAHEGKRGRGERGRGERDGVLVAGGRREENRERRTPSTSTSAWKG